MLRNTIILIMVWLLSTVLYGCNDTIVSENNLPKENTIVSVHDFSEREGSILAATSDNAMIFDFQLTEKYKEVLVWTEKYRFGERIKDKSGLTSLEPIEGSGTIVFAMPRGFMENEIFSYHIAIGSNGEFIAASRTDEEYSKDAQIKEMGMVSGSLDKERTIQDSEDLLLGYIGYSSNKQSMSSASTDVFHNPEIEKEELKDYNVAYLLKARFVK